MVNACVKGSMQSPIDIKSKHSVKCGALCDLIFIIEHLNAIY